MIARRTLFVSFAFALASLAGALGLHPGNEGAEARRKRKRRRKKHY